MASINRNFLTILSFVSAFMLSIFASVEFVHATDENNQELPQFSILHNANPNVTIENVCCGNDRPEFITSASPKFATGYGSTPIWLYWKKLPGPGILDFGTMVDDITLFLRDPSTGTIKSSRAGDMLNPNERQLLAPHIVFPINAEEASGEIFVKIVHPKYLSIAPQYHDGAAFLRAQDATLRIHLILIAAVAMIMVFNLLLGILIAQPVFLFNAGIVLSLSAVNLCFTGLGASYVWGQWAWASNSIFELSVIFGDSFGALFLFTFLRDAGQKQIIMRSLLIIPVIAAIVLVGWLFLPPWASQISQIILNAFTTIYCTIVVVTLSIRGHRRAQWMLPATLFAVTPGIVLLLLYRYFSVEPIFSSQHLIEITLLVEALFFSLLLAYRIRIAEKQATTALGKLGIVTKNASRDMIEKIDFERRRIGADLHDSAGQGLMTISNRLDQLLLDEELSVHQINEINKTAKYSRSIIGDIRRISHDLHPVAIEHVGWREAIKELFNILRETSTITVDLDLDVPPNLVNTHQKLHLYRIVQEVISNISRHSSAQYCKGKFYVNKGCLYVEISDDGNWGVDDDADAGAGLGHVIIKQRIASLDGQWVVDQLDHETNIRFNIPLMAM